MDVLAFADVDDDGLAAVLDGVLRLGLDSRSSAQSLVVACRGFLGHEVGQLHPVEGEVALLPLVRQC
jgi:hypothetical protein